MRSTVPSTRAAGRTLTEHPEADRRTADGSSTLATAGLGTASSGQYYQ
jgi:hypothetical protein